jgi:hypothetical protein
MSQSEVAHLRAQIAREYQASTNVFTGFTLTARHEFITKRQENIAGCFECLKQYMSGEEAFALLLQVDDEVHGLTPSGGAR